MIRPIAILSTLLLFVAGCAGAPAHAPAAAQPAAAAMPILRLAPATLPGGLALQQRLTFEHGERRDTLDALVESDAGSTRLLVHAQGQVALRLLWDGTTLEETRAPWLPASVGGERVLSDLQLVFWPAPAIRAALPAGWTLVDTGDRRELREHGATVVVVEGAGGDHARLQQLREHYVLDIQSQPVTP